MKYHRLIYNSQDEGCTRIIDYDLGKFDLVRFWRQGNLNNIKLSELSVFISDGHPADYLPTPISIPIVSKRLKNHLLNWQNDVKFTSLKPAVKKAPEGLDFYIIEFFTTYPSLNDLVGERHIVRIRNKGSGKIYLSDSCTKSFIGKGFRPVAFIGVNK